MGEPGGRLLKKTRPKPACYITSNGSSQFSLDFSFLQATMQGNFLAFCAFQCCSFGLESVFISQRPVLEALLHSLGTGLSLQRPPARSLQMPPCPVLMHAYSDCLVLPLHLNWAYRALVSACAGALLSVAQAMRKGKRSYRPPEFKFTSAPHFT